jgi:hypothetical protein
MESMPILREALKNAHNLFRGTVADLTPEDAHYVPQGAAHPIGSRYVHLVVADDVMGNVVLKGGAPLYETTFKGKTGADDPSMMPNLEWARRVHVDLPAFAKYADAVFKASEAQLDAMTDKDLERTVDLTKFGVGMVPMPNFLNDFVIGHVRDVMGEISAVKGLLGKKGYPY